MIGRQVSWSRDASLSFGRWTCEVTFMDLIASKEAARCDAASTIAHIGMIRTTLC